MADKRQSGEKPLIWEPSKNIENKHKSTPAGSIYA